MEFWLRQLEWWLQQLFCSHLSGALKTVQILVLNHCEGQHEVTSHGPFSGQEAHQPMQSNVEKRNRKKKESCHIQSLCNGIISSNIGLKEIKQFF